MRLHVHNVRVALRQCVAACSCRTLAQGCTCMCGVRRKANLIDAKALEALGEVDGKPKVRGRPSGEHFCQACRALALGACLPMCGRMWACVWYRATGQRAGN